MQDQAQRAVVLGHGQADTAVGLDAHQMGKPSGKTMVSLASQRAFLS